MIKPGSNSLRENPR